ncbi:MAG: DUF1858 domain-containing protein [Bacteroidales bacterium]|nr:DUF1858 domain-containing protein [Bacteroidales bacterium]
MAKTEITKDILIETLVEEYPFSVRFLMEKGIRCIMCGEPIWGTLEEACIEKRFSEEKIEAILAEMKSLAEKGDNPGQLDTKVDVKKMD